MAPGLELRVTQLQPLDLLARPVPFLAPLLVLLAKCLDLSLVGVRALPPSLLLFDDGAWSLALPRLVSVALSVPSITSLLAPIRKNASIVTQIEPNPFFSCEMEMSNLEGASECRARPTSPWRRELVPFQLVRGPGQRARLRTDNEKVCQNIYRKSPPMWPRARTTVMMPPSCSGLFTGFLARRATPTPSSHASLPSQQPYGTSSYRGRGLPP